MRKIGLIVAILICAGIAIGNEAPNQNNALQNARNVSPMHVMELSGTPSAIFNCTEFQQTPLKHRGLSEWETGMQGYEYNDVIWSIRDFLTYEKAL